MRYAIQHKMTAIGKDQKPQTVILFPSLNATSYRTNESFAFRWNGETFSVASFIQDDFSDVEELKKSLQDNPEALDNLFSEPEIEGTVKNGKIVLTSFTSFSRDQKDRKLFSVLLAMGLGFNDLGIKKVNLDFVHINDIDSCYSRQILVKSESGYQSKVSDKTISIDLIPQDQKNGESFKYVARIGDTEVKGRLQLNEDIWCDSYHAFLNVDVDYELLWDLYFSHQIIQGLAIKKIFSTKNRDWLIHNHLKNRLCELDQEISFFLTNHNAA